MALDLWLLERTAELYYSWEQCRSAETARGLEEGFHFQLCGPEDHFETCAVRERRPAGRSFVSLFTPCSSDLARLSDTFLAENYCSISWHLHIRASGTIRSIAERFNGLPIWGNNEPHPPHVAKTSEATNPCYSRFSGIERNSHP